MVYIWIMERIARTKNGNIVVYKNNDEFIIDRNKHELLSDGQLKDIADNALNNVVKGAENGRAEK